MRGSTGGRQVSEAHDVGQQESLGNAGTLGHYTETQESDTTWCGFSTRFLLLVLPKQTVQESEMQRWRWGGLDTPLFTELLRNLHSGELVRASPHPGPGGGVRTRPHPQRVKPRPLAAAPPLSITPATPGAHDRPRPSQLLPLFLGGA